MTVYEEHKEIVQKISREGLYSSQVLLSKTYVDYKICQNKTDSISSEMIRELQKVKDYLNIVTINEFMSTEEVVMLLLDISQKQTASMNEHLSKIKIFDKSQHKSALKPVQFIRSIKKTNFPILR